MDRQADRLRAMASQLLQIAETAGNDSEAVFNEFDYQDQTMFAGLMAQELEKKILVLARVVYGGRRFRERLFSNPELFGEPGWDILLDLFIAKGAGKVLSVTDSCIGSAAPATTALRWLDILGEEDLVRREEDVKDRRRRFVSLTDKGFDLVSGTLEAMLVGGVAKAASAGHKDMHINGIRWIDNPKETQTAQRVRA